MTRKTLYGTLTHDEVMNENEKAMLYIKECAESVGIEVIDGKTAFSIPFMAEVMKRLREKHEPILDKIRAEIEEMYADIDDVRIRNGLNLARRTITKYKAGSEE